MKFHYTTLLADEDASGAFLMYRRPEIEVVVIGPLGEAKLVGLVDTGSDNTIIPQSVADKLGIALSPMPGPTATVFGGHRVAMLLGQIVLKLEANNETVAWETESCFFQFAELEDETVILGHFGFLDYFTAVSTA